VLRQSCSFLLDKASLRSVLDLVWTMHVYVTVTKEQKGTNLPRLVDPQPSPHARLHLRCSLLRPGRRQHLPPSMSPRCSLQAYLQHRQPAVPRVQLVSSPQVWQELVWPPSPPSSSASAAICAECFAESCLGCRNQLRAANGRTTGMSSGKRASLGLQRREQISTIVITGEVQPYMADI
jgi:hypothetical protein